MVEVWDSPILAIRVIRPLSGAAVVQGRDLNRKRVLQPQSLQVGVLSGLIGLAMACLHLNQIVVLPTGLTYKECVQVQMVGNCEDSGPDDSVNTLDVPLFRGVAAPDCADWPIFCLELVPGFPQFGKLGSTAQGLQLFGRRIQAVDGKNSSAAVFTEVTWRFLKNWSVTAGVRCTEDEWEFHRSQVLSAGILDPLLACPDGSTPTNDTLAGVVGPMTWFAEADFQKVTPRIIFSYDVTDTIMLYGGWSKGYSSGDFNQDVRMRPFDPEESDNWEFGMQSTFADNRVLLNVTGFYNDYKNQQITAGRTVDNQPTADPINAQKVEIWGIEGDAPHVGLID
jgi:iron complex outermembrane receptor protein